MEKEIPKLKLRKQVGAKNYDVDEEILIDELVAEAQKCGATKFAIDAETEYRFEDREILSYCFIFYKEVEETDSEYNKRVKEIRQYEKDQKERVENSRKLIEKMEYEQYLVLKKKFEK